MSFGYETIHNANSTGIHGTIIFNMSFSRARNQYKSHGKIYTVYRHLNRHVNFTWNTIIHTI